MTTFEDGPAFGQTLLLRRAPFFLRVTFSPERKWDALDQLKDQPEPEETITVYRKVRESGWVHLCGRGRGAVSGRFVIAVYRLHGEQPADETARSIREWRKWCEAQAEQLRQPEQEKQ
jgi:hypothetical protein